jgi:SPP1 gp7 family putative phage head morphogenesis protein
LGEVDFEPLPFQEAIDYFRSKTNLTPAEFARLSAAARAKAFTIADGSSVYARGAINELLDQALSDGLTLKDFQSQAADVLDSAGLSARTPWYWETVYRTNLQTSYQVGRWKQMTDPDVVKERPYLRYVSALLPTSRPSHVEKHGAVYPVGDSFWDIWYPPNGFNCVCTATSVSESLLSRRGWALSTGQSWLYDNTDEGFAGNAGKSASI